MEKPHCAKCVMCMLRLIDVETTVELHLCEFIGIYWGTNSLYN